MTAETRSSVPETVEKSTIEEAIFVLACERLQLMYKERRRPANIVVGIEAFLLSFKKDLIIVKTDDSIAMMVGTKFKRIYYAELD
jgi:hypothetical protein